MHIGGVGKGKRGSDCDCQETLGSMCGHVSEAFQKGGVLEMSQMWRKRMMMHA
jgi:hypothetical protein